MTHYEDLSPYSYSDWPTPMVNVGWLGAGQPFETGGVASAVVTRLAALAATPCNIMRGLHYCEFCDAESPIRVETARGRAFLGTGEIHIRSSPGIIYAAPTLIVHYIDAHRYRPPERFTDAALASAPGQCDGDPLGH